MEHSLGTLKELLNFNLTNNTSMADKTDVLKKIYFDRSGFGSMRRTFAEAKVKDKTITMSDVKTFFEDWWRRRRSNRKDLIVSLHHMLSMNIKLIYSLLMMYPIKDIK